MCWTIQTVARICCTSIGRRQWMSGTQTILRCSSWRPQQAQGRTKRICGAPEVPPNCDVKTQSDRLSSGTISGFLEQGKKLVSANRKYEAEMQTDGNFVIYAPNRVPIWSTRTNGKGAAPYKLAMQADSNLVIYAGYRRYLGQRCSQADGAHTHSSCRTTAISSWWTNRKLWSGRAIPNAEASPGRQLAWAAVRLFSHTDK